MALALAASILALLLGGYLLIRRHGRLAAAGEQAKAALDVAGRVQDVPQPLPGETEDALRRGKF